ncbi:MAG: hypothetical protein E7620_05385 [Ruminococcaceae bacterium]|nr:hypothetical protein [Oscillospiraceae bacterium]
MGMLERMAGTKNGKKSRLQTKAEQELDIARACCARVKGKLDTVREEKTRIENDIKRIEENIREYAAKTGKRDGEEIREMAAEIGEKKQEIAFLRVVYKQLGLVYDGVKKLELHVRGCIHLGYYRFVIRTIPEKKIQKGIESENAEDFEAVLVMVLAIVDKIMTRVNKDSTRKRLFDETMAELMDTGILNNEEAAAASATDSILQDIFKDVEIDIPANATLPVEDSEVNNEIQA